MSSGSGGTHTKMTPYAWSVILLSTFLWILWGQTNPLPWIGMPDRGPTGDLVVVPSSATSMSSISACILCILMDSSGSCMPLIIQVSHHDLWSNVLAPSWNIFHIHSGHSVILIQQSGVYCRFLGFDCSPSIPRQ
jgi:hypothetical protein